MKTRIISIILAGLAASSVMTGCIEETYPMGSTQREDQVVNSDLALAGMANGIPASMMKMNTSGYYAQYGTQIDFGIPALHIATDLMLEDIAFAGNFNALQFYFYPYNIGQGDDEWPVAYFWSCYYTWIKLCNDVIGAIDPDSEETTDTMLGYLGQAYAYRAMCYLDLARLYEPKVVTTGQSVVGSYEVPQSILGLTVAIVTENTTEDEAMNNPRATREDLYNFIFEDLKKAETYLATAGTNYSSPTLGAVYGLYARAYLEQGYWGENNSTVAANDPGDRAAFEQAATYARRAISQSGKTPLTQAEWTDSSNGFNNGSSNNSWIWGLTVSSEQINNLLQFNAHMSTEALWGYAPMCQPAINVRLFEQIPDNDFRKLSWLDPAWTQFGGTKEIDYEFAGSETDHNTFINGNINEGGNVYPAVAYESIKFRPVMGEMNDNVTGGPADHPLMRVEEMYFIEMEAVAHYDISQAVSLLNTFMQSYRTTDGQYDCSTDVQGDLRLFIDEMMLQKRIEFWGEGILFYDYKRLDKGITRAYTNSNHPSIWQFNTLGRSPQWNLAINTVSEMMSNEGITNEVNNPDPSGMLEVQE